MDISEQARVPGRTGDPLGSGQHDRLRGFESRGVGADTVGVDAGLAAVEGDEGGPFGVGRVDVVGELVPDVAARPASTPTVSAPTPRDSKPRSRSC